MLGFLWGNLDLLLRLMRCLGVPGRNSSDTPEVRRHGKTFPLTYLEEIVFSGDLLLGGVPGEGQVVRA